jgi:ribitol-5-phosphate 2-dehydrogenase (NADP+) / D-ribitol-5-phosphate cytidylyltransferase
MHEVTACILLAGGSGTRLAGDQPKQFVRIAGKTILEHSLGALRQNMPEAVIVVTTPFEDVAKVSGMFSEDPLVEVVAGGASRQASTLRGLKALARHKPRNVMIHDAARPFLDGRIIRDVLEALKEHDAIDVAIPTADTIIVEREGYIDHIPKRQHLLRGQTPQAFRYKDLVSCYQTLGEHKLDQFTDDCGIFMACNPEARVWVVKGSEENIKVTFPIDLILADEMFRLRSQTSTIDKPGVNLRGKRAVIFGGTRGIGKAMADIMLAGGAQVSVCSRESGCDITREEDVQRALQNAADEFGGIDVVVNAAGLLKNGKLHEQTAADAADQININLTGALNVARLAHFWLEQTQGSLLLFASSSYTRGRAGSAVYSATKAAIVNLTQGLSEEWAEDGIRVNCIVPGRTDTEMRTSNFKAEAQDSLFNPYHIALSASRVICSSTSGLLERVH